jgi:hypothetical protein
MPIYIKKSAGLDKILKGSPIISEIRKDFNTRGPNTFRKAILADMNKSISPVKGKGKWVKYSESYIKQIKGELGFFTKDNKVIPVTNPQINLGQLWDKQVSPVNLKLSGELHNSLKVFGVGLLSKVYVLRVQFNDFLADIHNRRGASKKKVIRRLLPTESNEEFNYGLTRVLLNSLRDSVARVVNKFNA